MIISFELKYNSNYINVTDKTSVTLVFESLIHYQCLFNIFLFIISLFSKVMNNIRQILVVFITNNSVAFDNIIEFTVLSSPNGNRNIFYLGFCGMPMGIFISKIKLTLSVFCPLSQGVQLPGMH